MGRITSILDRISALEDRVSSLEKEEIEIPSLGYLKQMRKSALVSLANDLGLDSSGTKSEVIDVLENSKGK